LITPDVSSSWAARNFGGTILRRRIEVDAMIAEIALYDADEFSRMRAAILPLVSMERYLDELEQLHDRTVKHQAKRCDVSLAKALESALPNYKLGGFYPFQAYELKSKAEARADAFSTYQRSTSERRRDICISGSTFQMVQTARLMP
tara:strand:+ start:731 stop:1171 length:441 start_codon:yes stop_codon:yes gene_type:complete